MTAKILLKLLAQQEELFKRKGLKPDSLFEGSKHKGQDSTM
jgi:hypothetical protein